MIARLILWSIANRFLVLLASLGLAAWGVWATLHTPVDAIPDLSDTQVIIRTTWPGQAPQIVENQVTYPLTTTMMSVPGAKVVRGFSFFGDSFVYIIFEDGTDLYWARSRVLEYLNQVQGRLPPAAKSAIGPDATGVGWIYQYALVDRTGKTDLAQLRAIQDWLLKFELKSVPNVAEVATVGGMVKQYQIVLDPDRLRALGITHAKVIEAIGRANQEVGGSVLELGEAEYMVRASGYLKTLDDFRRIPVVTTEAGVAVRLADVARIQVGPEMRRGIAELDGEGEVAGGIIVMRSGKNALETIDLVKAKLESLKRSLPAGVEIVPVYDRSDLIKRSMATVGDTLVEQFAVVAIICIVFLFHWRSAFVSIVSLPLGVTTAFIVMHYQGITANIVSLGGIAIAIGEMVDAAVVMVENAHRKLEAWQKENPGREIEGDERWKLIGDASVEVGPALFSSLLIVTISFIPVFALQAQEGRLFSPLAFTKTYAMAAAAGLAVTLVPVLMGMFIRGRIPAEEANPVNRFLIAVYRPLLDAVVRHPVATIVGAFMLAAATLWPASKLGGEFMPPLDEGDILYMPSALPGLSAGKASELLQQTDRLIKTVPEVLRVFGKAGRAETATDPAPLEMFETTIQLKPRDQWRPGMTMEKLVAELDAAVKVPGLANIWIPPIRNRIDMLATGIKSPVGVKVAGENLGEIERIAGEIERAVKDIPGVSSALAERITGGRYIDIDVDRDRAARYGLNVADVQSLVSAAIGGGEHRRDDRGPAALSDQRALSAGDARFPRRPEEPAGAHGARGADPPRRRGAGAHHRRRTDDPQRRRAALGLGVRGHPGARPAFRGARHAARRGREGHAAAGLFRRVERAVRVPRARAEAPRARGARHADDHLHHALPHVPADGRIAPDPRDAALLAGGRRVAAARAGPRGVRRHGRGLHRAGGRHGRVRHRDARLPQDGLGGARGRGPHERRGPAGGRARRRGAARAPEGHDGGHHRDRPRAHPVGERNGLGDHEPHRSADGGRHDHRPPHLDVRRARGVAAAAPAGDRPGRPRLSPVFT
jgi:Cu(I)/Ag(I) efflux system membrane protein CusA/SilA